MSNRISIYGTDPKTLRDDLGTAEDLEADEVASGLMALCGIVASLASEQQKTIDILTARINLLEKSQAGNQRTADLASMLANGIKPD